MRYYDVLADPSIEANLLELGYSPLNVKVVLLNDSEIDRAYARDSLVFVRASNTLEKNRRILRMPCDGIVDPVFPKLTGLDFPALTIARDNDCAVVFTLKNLARYSGVDRGRYLSRARLIVKMAQKKGVRVLLSSGARKWWELKTPLQLIAFGKLLGMTDKQAKRAIGPAVEYVRGRVYDSTNNKE